MHARQRRGALVGRAHELLEVDRGLARVVEGEPWVVQLVGEPGIGKSRLLAELAHRSETRGFLALDGRAAEFEQDIPFGMIVDALNDYLGTLEPAFERALDDGVVQELAEVFPSLSRFASELPGGDVQASRYRFRYAIRAVLERLAAQRPVLLALDDVHWADPESLDVIAHLLRRFRGPLLVALASRSTPARLAAAVEEAALLGVGTRLDLGPLTADEAQELVGPELERTTYGALYRESGGNPFYLEQLVRSGPGDLELAAASEQPTGTWTLPPAVSASIGAELDPIVGDSRVVLDAAAIIGESFEPELVAAVADRSLGSTLAAVDELLEADLIRPTATPQRFRFRHPIVRRAVYDGTRRGWRLGAHARAAAALMADHAPASSCAHHVERSAIVGDELGIGVLVAAARAAAPRAPLTAGRWLLAAERLLPGGADPERRLQLLVEAAAALTSGGAYEESLAALEEALALVPADQDARRADVIARIAYAKRRSGRPFDSPTVLESALAGLHSDEGAVAAGLRLELALHHFWHDDFASLSVLSGELLRGARVRADLGMISLSLALRSLASAERSVEDALAELSEAEAAFAGLQDEQLAERIYVSFYLGLAELRLERADDAFAHTNRGLDVARMTGQAVTVTPWPAIASRALLMKGQVSEAVRLAHGAIDSALLAADDWRTVWALESDAMAAFWAGDNERALTSSWEMVARSDRVHGFLSGSAQIQLAGAEYAMGDTTSAADRLAAIDVEPTRRLLDCHGAHGWELLTRALLALGEVDRAQDTVGRASRRAEASGLAQRRSTVRCAQAAVLLARGESGAVHELLAEAIADADAAGNPLLSARSRALAGIALAAGGHHARGIAELERAERVLFACGAAREADGTARELRRLGRRVPRRTRVHQPPGLSTLSSREREVAGQVAAGKTNRQVASALFLSEKTIESHLARIYGKLGVHSRAALATLVGREAGARGRAGR